MYIYTYIYIYIQYYNMILYLSIENITFQNIPFNSDIDKYSKCKFQKTFHKPSIKADVFGKSWFIYINVLFCIEDFTNF